MHLRRNAIRRSGRLDPLLDVVRALARPELDDAKVSKTVLVKRIFLDDGFDFSPALAHGEDDPAHPRYLSTRDEEIPGGVILLQEPDVRGHVRVDLAEVGLIGELDDEHRRRACIKRRAT